jgi:hypothetical protein
MKQPMSKIRIYGLVLSLFSFSLPCFSANFAFLYDTPAQYFNAQDWKMLETAAENALARLPNGKSITWQNPATGNGGLLKPLNSMKKHGTTCRDLQITNHAQHRTDRYVFMFCQFKTGWKIPNKSM